MVVDGKKVFVIWVRFLDNRLYMCRESNKLNEWNYYIRDGMEIKKVKLE